MTEMVKGTEVKAIKVDSVESKPVQGGEVWVKWLATGENLKLMEATLKKGSLYPLHKHATRDSVGYVIRGKLRMIIGDKTYILNPGDSWYHGFNVQHSTEALEDSLLVEAHREK